MKIETFFEKFDLFADAPGAVGKMRELVLDFAISGKLIPSESEWPNRPLKSLSTKIGSGATPKGGRESYFSEGVPLIRSMNVHFRGFEPTGLVYLSDEQADLLSNVIVQQNDVLLNITGASIGRVTVAPAEMDGARVNQHVTIIRSNKELLPRFLALFLASPSIQRMINEVQVGATRQALTKGMIEKFEIPLPPVAEQKRIVAKVDELMALCDRLEEQQQERETRHAALVRASLARFSDAPTPANLNFLFHPSYTISPADLRKSILTLAVQGKLVPQDPNEEPAEELVARIVAMRHAKAKQYKPVSPDEVPYEVPFSWAWVRLGNISLTSDSGWSPQCLPGARSGTDWGVLKVSAVSWGVFKPDENKALPPEMTSRPECEVKAGDFLLSLSNTEDLVSRSVVVDQTPPRLMMSDKIVRFTFPDEIERAFINLANTSEPSRAYYARNASGTSSSMKNIGREVMCNLPIPLPPLSEQRRIVAKVEQLMALVDALKTQLAASRATAANLLSVLVAELTSTPEGRVASPAPAKPIAVPPRPKPQKAIVAPAKPAAQESTVSPRTLADLRKGAGLTQAAVAEAMGLNQAYISQMETGKRSITEEQHKKLVEILGLSMN